MTHIKYSHLYKEKYRSISEFSSENEFDLLISTYNESDRVKNVFLNSRANQKYWLLLPENSDYAPFLRAENVFTHNISYNDYNILFEFIQKLEINGSSKICIDITGFLIPHLLFFLKSFQFLAIKKFDVIYTEPDYYINREETTFSQDYTLVKQILGFEGSHNPDISNDLLIIASGYDDSRIVDVANSKAKAKKIQLFGFPSLKADMYQENIIKAYKAEPSLGSDSFSNLELNLFAPANDPFIAAEVLSNYIKKEQRKKEFTNIYLSPISTKAHALGMGLFYIWECSEKPVSIIYPLCEKHFGNTSRGISKIIKYSIIIP